MARSVISHIVIKPFGEGDDVVGILRLVTASGLHNIQVDAAAALATAIHMGIPIFMDGEFSSAESGSGGHIHDVHGQEAATMAGGEPSDQNAGIDPGVITPIPRVFQDLIDGFGVSDGGQRRDGGAAPDEEP